MTRYRLRVALVDSEPENWREFDIDGRMPLRMLHIALQTIVGWRESHLPPPIRSELRQHLHLTGVLEPLELDDETAARIVHPFA